ncbi:MAG: transcription antitermination factor NusB [Planctomycetes bacterium]|nr:transcription antitermination factor NusB [Planctomycetota bacterium]
MALQCLHQWDQRGPDEGRDLAEAQIGARERPPEVSQYARKLLATFWEHCAAIDETIEAAASNWRLARMAVVDRSVLRIAVTELHHIHAVPPKVAIDEAIELAKKYSTEKSGAFVNGILDRILSDWVSRHGPR